MSGMQTTAEDSVKRWTDQLDQYFKSIAAIATELGWTDSWDHKDAKEDPFSLGASVSYDAPILQLKRLHGTPQAEQRVTFEPFHRFTIGAAGRIDIYAYPSLREAMLLRAPNLADSEKLTWDEAETRVATAPWILYSADRIPLKADISDPVNLKSFLEDMTA